MHDIKEDINALKTKIAAQGDALSALHTSLAILIEIIGKDKHGIEKIAQTFDGTIKLCNEQKKGTSRYRAMLKAIADGIRNPEGG